MNDALDALAPLLSLRLSTPRLELRLPSPDELVELAQLARAGIHPPDEMPFAVAWTDNAGSLTFLGDFAAHHESARAEWTPEDWSLLLGVWAEGELVGSQGLVAEDFPRRRHVKTGSWLGQPFQRRGYGTEMRTAVLELAFRGLGAESAESGALEGNVASARVSEKLGYERSGEGTLAPRGEPVREQRYLLRRERWRAPVQVELEGLEPCLALFGLS